MNFFSHYIFKSNDELIWKASANSKIWRWAILYGSINSSKKLSFVYIRVINENGKLNGKIHKL